MIPKRYKCRNCGAEVPLREDTGVYVCEFCRSVTAFVYLPEDEQLRKQRREREKGRQEIDGRERLFRMKLLFGGLAPQAMSLAHCIIFQPYSYENVLDNCYDLTNVIIDLVLMTISALFGLFGTVKDYRAGKNRRESGRTRTYAMTKAVILGMFALNMFAFVGKGIKEMLFNGSGETVILAYIALLIICLIVYPLYECHGADGVQLLREIFGKWS